ncbi:MAG: hypothetical protein KDB43_11700 [Nocardioidaceae bacterium]|nr:hypothetical protein [Nocardioidaceae bacterium]
MMSSGMKRGLALSAVSALAFAGLALSPANAQTIDVTQNTTGPTLYTPTATGEYSTKVDGNGNTTVTLLATAGKTIGGQTVNTIRFWTPANPALLDVHVPVVAGVASYQWAAPANVGAAVQVRADAEAAGNLSLGFDTQNVDTTSPNANQSVSIHGANRDKMGLYFMGGAWTGAVTGKTGTGAAPAVNVAGPGTASAGATSLTSGPDSNGLSSYLSILTVNPDNLHSVSSADDGNPTDDLVVTADNGQDADGRVFSVYHQLIPNGGATAAVRAGSTANVFGSVPDSYNADDANPANDRTFYNVKVVDQFGAPIVGVPVYEANANGTANGANVGAIIDPAAPNASNFANGTTAADGIVQVRLDEGTMDGPGDLDPASGVQATFYVVDSNGNGTFENGVDYLLKVSQTNLPSAPASIQMTNDLGTAMDDDETSPFHVKVLDADGNGINNSAVNVLVTVKDATTGATLSATNQLGVTNSSGVYNTTLSLAAFDDQHIFVTVKASTTNGVSSTFDLEGDRSQVVWKPSHIQGAVGSQVEAKGVLQLPSGKTLKGRTIALNLTPGIGAPADARFPTATQPTGTVAGTPTTATATTQDAGKFSVFLKDGATTGQELNDQIAATSPGLEITSDYPGGYPTNIERVDFLRNFTVSKVEIRNYDDDSLDSLWSPFAGDDDLQPGKLGLGYVQAYNSDNVELVNVDVPVKINEGNFVNPANLFDPAAVVGGKVGEWSDAGKSVTVNTGDGNDGAFVINIERNAGFDDNGLVADKVVAGSGNASFEYDFNWNTMDVPLNSGSYSVELAPQDEQESSILPKARAGHSEAWSFDGTGQQVFYNVTATDQFGNRTQQPLTVSDDSPVADFISGTGFETQYTLDDYAITAFSPSTANQSLEVELDNQTTTVYSDNPFDSSFDPSDPITIWTLLNFYDQPSADIQKDTAPINWYTLDYDASTFTLSHEGADTVPAGTQITNTLTATDQEGQKIAGVPVGFLRVGPSDDGDSDGNPGDYTNENGEAFYDWAGNEAGLADVTAVIYNDNEVRQFVVGPDKLTFTGEQKVGINLMVTGRSDGNKDVVKVNADSVATGAMAVVKRGGEVIRSHRLNSDGDWNFRITDHNGNKKITKYRVVVAETASTLQASKRLEQK